MSQIAWMAETWYDSDVFYLLKRLNKTINYAQDNKASIPILESNSDRLRVVARNDAAFANNANILSQLERIALFPNMSESAVTVSYQSSKLRRLTDYLLYAEVIPLADLLDEELSICKQMEFILKQKISVHMLTYLKSFL